MATERINEATEDVNVANSNLLLQVDTMEQLYSDERKLFLEQIAEMDKRNKEEIESIEKRNVEERESMRKHFNKIIFVQAITLFLFVASVVGAALYVYSNFDFEFIPTYSQDVSSEGGGNATIEDGIHINENDHPVE